jgi:hypothetical protein
VERHLSISRVKEYRSLRELADDSAAVVQVTAQERIGEVPAAQDGTGELTSTLTRVAVERVFFSRQPLPTELTVRQTGSPDVVVDGNAELLAPGRTYILFLVPFTFSHANTESTGEWITVGEIAAWRRAESGFLSVATDRGPLPRRIEIGDLLSVTS